MNKLFNILIIIAFFPIFVYQACSQNSEAQASIIIENISLTPADTVSFDIITKSYQDTPIYFANASFYIKLTDSSEILTDDNYFLNYQIGSSALNIKAISGSMPIDGYHVKTAVKNGLACIDIIGAENIDNSNQILTDGIRLGRFSLISKYGEIKSKPIWASNDNIKQVIAFKSDKDIDFSGETVFFVNDNIEFWEDASKSVDFFVGGSQCDNTKIEHFDAVYKGGGSVKLTFATLIECNTSGFAILRFNNDLQQNKNDEITYDTVGCYLYEKDKNLLTSNTKSNSGREYSYIDTCAKYGKNYCYELFAGDKSNILQRTGYIICLRIPELTISYLNASPNPFNSVAKIEYFLETESTVTITAYDIRGAVVTTLAENKLTQPGRHLLEYHAGDKSTQGFYEFVVSAVPTNSKIYENSKAAIKIQLIK